MWIPFLKQTHCYKGNVLCVSDIHFDGKSKRVQMGTSFVCST